VTTPEGPAGEVEPASLFTRVGGEEFFTRLTAGFYARVATDAVLRPMYPEDELGAAEERLRLFLIQYWGGPATYSEQRGHPRLRMRHAPFAIGSLERDRWLVHMLAAVDEVATSEDVRAEIAEYMVRAAEHMVNVEG